VAAHHRPSSRRRFKPPTWKMFLRFFGVIGAAWEIFFQHADRPDVLLLIGGMLGLPEFFKSKPDDGNDDGGTRTGHRRSYKGKR
jgi:hypothetical protein